VTRPFIVATIDAAIETLRQVGFARLQALGWHFQRCDFYSPLNDVAFLRQNQDLWKAHEPADVDLDLDRQLAVAREVSRHVDELRDVPAHSDDPTVYHWQNNFWNNADALVQYGLIRARKPRRVIEVGCGYSSLLLARATTTNQAEGSHRADVTQIEPYPRREVMAGLPSHWTLHECILQRAPLEVFDALGDGDMLFYDGSHCSKVASDVNWLFFRVLPRLTAGVLIHVHDIFFPGEYPEPWIFERGQTWNEQYVLQAFLMGNPQYQVEICNSHICHHRSADLEALYRGVAPHWGCSIWIRKLSRPSSQ
jgi:predicted O-methyltransferase YrrM